jgi:hypothetical protein
MVVCQQTHGNSERPSRLFCTSAEDGKIDLIGARPLSKAERRRGRLKSSTWASLKTHYGISEWKMIYSQFMIIQIFELRCFGRLFVFGRYRITFRAGVLFVI